MKSEIENGKGGRCLFLAMAAAMVDFWLHVDSCAKKYDKKLQETADEISRGLSEASRRLQR